MKKSLLAIAMMTAQVSFAAPLFCSGGSWTADTNSSQTSAQLKKNGHSVQFGDLSCQTVYPKGGSRPGTPILTCKTSQPVADAGYSLTVLLSAPGVDMKGIVTSQTKAGPHTITNVTCIGAANR